MVKGKKVGTVGSAVDAADKERALEEVALLSKAQ
jgi:hypothetical protein